MHRFPRPSVENLFRILFAPPVGTITGSHAPTWEPIPQQRYHLSYAFPRGSVGTRSGEDGLFVNHYATACAWAVSSAAVSSPEKAFCSRDCLSSLRALLVPTLLRGNPYRSNNITCRMHSHAGAWEREAVKTACSLAITRRPAPGLFIRRRELTGKGLLQQGLFEFVKGRKLSYTGSHAPAWEPIPQ
jgi:hypothetical protein